MGVGDNGGSAVGQNCLDELLGGDHGALQMDMGVNEPGQDDPSGHVHLCFPAVHAHPHNEPLCNGNIAMTDLVAEYVDIGGIFQHQISLFPARRHLHNPQFLAHLPVDFAGVAFSSHTLPSFLPLPYGSIIVSVHFVLRHMRFGICNC